MRAPAKIYMRKNSPLRKDAPACLPEKFANPDAGFNAITGLQGIAGITGELGYEVLAVDSPKEAIRLARSFAGGIDLLVTDMVMPKMSGPELIDALHEDLPGLKVLFISGYIHQIKEVWNNDILGIGFLQKPFTLNDLSVKVHYILHQHDEKK